MKKTWWAIQMLLALPFALLVAPFLGIWTMGQFWLEHWLANYRKKDPVGVWSRPHWTRL